MEGCSQAIISILVITCALPRGICPLSESLEHKRINELVTSWLKEWFDCSIKEYPSSGHEHDVHAVAIDGTRIYFETIWSESRVNFFRDLNMIQQAEEEVKLVAASPAVLSNDEYQRELSKVVASQLRRGVAMLCEFVEGQRILDEPEYKNELKDIVTKLVEARRGRVPTEPEFTPPTNPSADNVSEILSSNLFPVKMIPAVVFGGLTSARRDKDVFENVHGNKTLVPAFILKSERIYTFDILRKTDSVFSKIVDKDNVTEEKTSQWMNDDDKRRDLIRLLNMSLRLHILQRPNITYRKKRKQFVHLLNNGKDNIFDWRTRKGRKASRALAMHVYSKQTGRLLYCWHNSASIRFIVLDGSLFSKIEPTFAFTRDGYAPVARERIPSLMSKRAPMQYNNAYRDTVRLWAKWLSKRDIEVSIPVGEQRIVVDTSSARVKTRIGIKKDT